MGGPARSAPEARHSTRGLPPELCRHPFSPFSDFLEISDFGDWQFQKWAGRQGPVGGPARSAPEARHSTTGLAPQLCRHSFRPFSNFLEISDFANWQIQKRAGRQSPVGGPVRSAPEA